VEKKGLSAEDSGLSEKIKIAGCGLWVVVHPTVSEANDQPTTGHKQA
jgi:hypothetical protein